MSGAVTGLMSERRPGRTAPTTTDTPTARSRRRTRPSAVAALTVGLASLPAIARSGLHADLRVHLRFAEDLALTGTTTAPYNLFQQLTVAVRAVIPFHLLARLDPSLGMRGTIWVVSGLVVLTVAAGATGWLVHSRLADVTGGRRPAVTVALAVALTLIGPITMVTWPDHQLLGGYIAANVFHNPSYLVLKPLALALFMMIVARVRGPRAPIGAVVAAAVLSVVGMQAKPSYAVCLLPALVLVGLDRRRRGEVWDLRFLGLGVVAPSVLCLGVQAWISRGQGSLEVDPFGTIRGILAARELPLWTFAAFVVLSVLFPLVTTVVHRAEASASTALQLAWATFLVGLALFSLVSVQGRTDHGDLLWGAEAALFILNVESLRIVLASRSGGWRPAKAARRPTMPNVVVAVFALHVLAGVAFWVLEIAQPTRWW